MQTRKFDELISYFNRNVSNMDIDQKYKIELFGMITAIGFAHEKELHNLTIEPQRKKGKWIEQDDSWDGVYYECSACGEPWTTIDGTPWDNGMNFCPHCGAEMREPEDIPMEYFESGGR